jgi:hypothetical protein
MAFLICMHPVPPLIGGVGTSGKIVPVSGHFGKIGKWAFYGVTAKCAPVSMLTADNQQKIFYATKS